MFRRYVKQLINSVFSRDTAPIQKKDNDIQRQVAKLKQLQRSAKHRQRPRKKDTVL